MYYGFTTGTGWDGDGDSAFLAYGDSEDAVGFQRDEIGSARTSASYALASVAFASTTG